MPKLAANLSLLFTEVPFLQRFAAAAAAGFRAVECQFPYECSAEQLASELQRHQLQLVLFNLPAGNWAAGERGIACHPGRQAEFRAGVEHALDYASVLGTTRINCLAGIKPDAVSEQEARDCLIANLGYAAERLQQAGIQLLVEPINNRDIPGFFLNRSAETLALLNAAGHTNLALQYDVYHMQVMEGGLSWHLAQYLPRIGHIQIADTPGRHEPGSGEINYRFVLAELDRLGYQGWVGCEYLPAQSTEAGLSWIEACGLSL